MSSARAVMRQRCTIERNQAETLDDWGGETDGDWQPHVSDQPCYVFYTTGKLEQQAQQTAAVEQLRILLPVDADINGDTDRISNVCDLRGGVLFAGPFVLDGPVARRADHLVATLKEAS